MKFSSSKRTLGIYNKLREPPVKRFVKSTVSYCPKKKIGKLVTLYFLAQDHQDFGTPQKCLGPQLDQTCGSQDPDSKILMSSPVVKDPFPWTSPPPPPFPPPKQSFPRFYFCCCSFAIQKAIDEVKYAVTNITTDLRDGLRLT